MRMSQRSAWRKTPVGRAVASAAVFAAFGVALRYLWGACDVDMESMSTVALAP